MRLRAVLAAACLANSAFAQALLPPPAPPQNPVTEAKRALGKVLFWDEQLSSDNTTACGTCHIPSAAGVDPRTAARHPGPDGVLNTADDVVGSFGLVRADDEHEFEPDPVFFLERQVTRRAANSIIMAAYAPLLFWDGRASGAFVDPQTNQTLIPLGGALESQAVGPPVSDIEMGHEGRDWDLIVHKIRRETPLALATNIPADLTAILAANPTYPMLFRAAFGDSEITSARIAFALATYQRTLVPNQAPVDLNQLTPQQANGRNTFVNVGCAICHGGPLFTNNGFRNIGLRPWQEDSGRMEVTGIFGDRGRFKVPSLRNVGLKPNFMHNGRLTTLNQVLDFYAGINGQVGFPDNRDPALPLAIPGPARANLIDFIQNGLTDPRVRDGVFPFDKPTLAGERPGTRPALLGAGAPGTGGFTPRMIALSPSAIGSDEFCLGLDDALAGAQAFIAVSSVPPVQGQISAANLVGPFTVQGGGAGSGFATYHHPIAADPALDGATLFFQWRVADPSAPGGVALSPVAAATFFCGQCEALCLTDIDADGLVGFTDLNILLGQYLSAGIGASGDLDGDGDVDFADLNLLLGAFNQPC